MDVPSYVALLLQGRSVFLTGGAGTGKTYTTRAVVEQLQGLGHFVLECGTTGVSALNLQNGMTLHSAFRLPVNETPTLMTWVTKTRQLMCSSEHRHLVQQIRSARVILIDEISMCSAYQFELLSMRLSLILDNCDRPFGGASLLLVGDFMQLAPVYNTKTTPAPHPRQQLYAFESPLWRALDPQVITLTTVHRQLDPAFAALLHQLRQGQRLTPEQRDLLRSKEFKTPPHGALCIMVKRDDVFAFNALELNRLPHRPVNLPFPQTLQGNSEELQTALLQDVQQSLCIPLGSKVQSLKTGARVMLVQNARLTGSAKGQKYVNGDRGTIEGWLPALPELVGTLHAVSPTSLLHESHDLPVVRFDRTQELVLVNYHHFERKIVSRHSSSNRQDEVKEYATLLAVPLCLAWASTVHKAQGSTIFGPIHIVCDNMDWITAAFYVALSRSTDLSLVTLQRFRSEGRVYDKAVKFYQGTYEAPASRVLETIQQRLTETEQERELLLCDAWQDVLETQLSRASHKKRFLEDVQTWVGKKNKK